MIRVENGSFTPIVTSAYGGFGVETSKFMSTVIDKLSEKHDMERSVVASYLRTKLSFHLIRTQVLCVRGSKTLKKPTIEIAEVELVQKQAAILNS